MDTFQEERRIFLKPETEKIDVLVESFLKDRRAQNLAVRTVLFYRQKLSLFLFFCEDRAIRRLEQISQDEIRQFLLWLEQTGHNPGGIHAAFRALRTFLFWFEDDFEPEFWKNPIRKVKAPKVPKEPIKGIELDDFNRLLATCSGHHYTALRDKAILLFLLDTGARANEVLSLNLSDCDFIAGRVIFRHAKGRKFRVGFFGKRTRKALRDYLKTRNDNNLSLWLTDEGEQLGYSGLRLLIKRRGVKAGLVEIPSPHDFRRAFALGFLRNGGDIFTLQKLMGHTDIQILRTYLAQTDADMQEGHSRFGVVDRI